MPNCTSCNTLLTNDNWQPHLRAFDYAICNVCSPRFTTEGQYAKQQKIKIKEETLRHYSPSLSCVYCGFNDIRALSIDHINGDGAKHRKELGNVPLYTWLKKNGYPAGFQVLCMNCQWIKRDINNENRHGSTKPQWQDIEEDIYPIYID